MTKTANTPETKERKSRPVSPAILKAREEADAAREKIQRLKAKERVDSLKKRILSAENAYDENAEKVKLMEEKLTALRAHGEELTEKLKKMDTELAQLQESLA